MASWFKKIAALPVLFCASAHVFAQSPAELHSWITAPEGWTVAPETEVFNPDNLFERINGAAPLFIENNFVELTCLTCTRGDDYITVQAYRHATPEDAFGMYASERADDMQHFDIGGEAQGDNYGLYFFAGAVYVKITASADDVASVSAMQSIAKTLADKIDPAASLPTMFKAFPAENKIPFSETYITRNYIGHKFLHPAFTADYVADGRRFQVFVIDGQTEENAQTIIEAWLAFAKQTETPSAGRLTVRDRYNGNIPLVLRNRLIIGAFDEKGEDFDKNIFDLLEKIKP